MREDELLSEKCSGLGWLLQMPHWPDASIKQSLGSPGRSLARSLQMLDSQSAGGKTSCKKDHFHANNPLWRDPTLNEPVANLTSTK